MYYLILSIHTVTSGITFHINKTAYISQNYTASCTVTANPRMNVYIYTQGCDFQCNTLQIDEYTTEATITINNITSACKNVTCATSRFRKQTVLGKIKIVLAS